MSLDTQPVGSRGAHQPARSAWRPLGDLLIERGLGQAELEQALRIQQQEGGRLGEILFERGLVSALDLWDALAEQHGLDSRLGRPPTRAVQPTPAERLRGSVPLGRLLVRRGQITEEQLEAALVEQSESGERLGRILIASGAASPHGLAAALAEQQGLAPTAQELWEAAQTHASGEEPMYEVRELATGAVYRLHSTRSFLDASDLALAVLSEWEPEELHLVCIGEDSEEICWLYRA
jgi:hypothetical protein